MRAHTITTVLVTALLITARYASAQGSLTPTNGPAPTMHTLEEIYQQLLVTQAQVADLQARMVAAGMQTTSGNMVLIPAGSFVMGDTFGEGVGNELPLHTNYVSAFWMDQTETTKAKWDEVYSWATNNGYAFTYAGSGKAPDHPVHTINWYDCVKWANARSEIDGFTPCYTTNGAIYKTGESDDVDCSWSAEGYRLPTEAEWEKAARGGVPGTRFPWSDVNTIEHARANYRANGSAFSYDVSPYTEYTYHPDYDSGGSPYTSPVGSFAPNGYGLRDMAGNVYEWCWDWYSYSYYVISPSTDPKGPTSGSARGARGSRWNSYASYCRVASRGSGVVTGSGSNYLGFRLVRKAP